MQSIFKRLFGICLFALALAAVILFGAFATEGMGANAEVSYNVGGSSLIFDYGQAVGVTCFEIGSSGKYYKITNFEVSEAENGVTSSLLDMSGKVQKRPRTYYLDANINASPCASDGSSLAGSCSGTITIVVVPTALKAEIATENLVKTYGETGASPAYTLSEDCDLKISFDSLGFSETADVGEYDLSVVWDDPEQSDYYTITVLDKETAKPARYKVIPRPIEILYDKSEGQVEAVTFNDYLLFDPKVDSVSVTSRSAKGVNGDELTAYFRLREPPIGSLTVGSLYEIEFCRYEVKRAEEDPLSYDAGTLSNYEVTVRYEEEDNHVLATAGAVTIYQGEGDPAWASDPTYLHLSDSAFSCLYLDSIVKGYKGEEEGEVVFKDVELYPGVLATLRCSLKGVKAGEVAVGEYELILKGYTCAAVKNLSFAEGRVHLRVRTRTLGAYTAQDKAEISTGNFFEKEVSVTFDEKEYFFTLSADLSGAKIGDSIAYSSCVSADPNTAITFDEARVIVGKRSTGVSIQTTARSVTYGDPTAYEIAVPYLNYGKVDALVIEEGEIFCEYRLKGGSSFEAGLPNEHRGTVGEYEVRCTLLSDLYETAPVLVDFTIVKKQVIARYEISKASKVYGSTFSFSGVGISLYPNDEETAAGSFDSAKKLVVYGGEISGTFLSARKGGVSVTASGASAGEYDFTSDLFSDVYAIEGYFVYDALQKKNVGKFVVEKADKPEVPSPEYSQSGREIRVAAQGTIRARISPKEDMSSSTERGGSGDAVSFTNLTYGQTYYLQARAEESSNYKNPSDWSEARKIVIAFPAPTVYVSELHSDSVTFVADALSNAVDGYVYQYAIGSSNEWKEGLGVEGLNADTAYRFRFRMKKGEAVGAEYPLSTRTLRASVDEDKVSYGFDRETGKLTVSTQAEGVEYRLLSSTGEVLSEWSEEKEFNDLQADSKYLLQVRLSAAGGAAASEVAEIEVDTHKVKEPFSVKGFLSDWFLAIVGGGFLVLMILFIVLFAKRKKRIDQEGLGGE